MADKKKFPNPAFFRARTEMDWKAQAANLKEVGSIALELIKETDWKAFGKKQKDHFLDNMNRVAREARAVAGMTGAQRKDLLLNGEKQLGTLYRKGDMATVRREWRGVESTLIDFAGWLKTWGMLLGTFSKDLIPALNTTFWYRWMISYMCCVSFMDKNTMGQRGNALRMSHLMTYDIFRYVAENLSGDGFCKLLYDRKNRCVVGVHLVGSYASEIIYGAAMMVHSKLPVQHLDKIVFPHPTVGEVVREALFLL